MILNNDVLIYIFEFLSHDKLTCCSISKTCLQFFDLITNLYQRLRKKSIWSRFVLAHRKLLRVGGKLYSLYPSHILGVHIKLGIALLDCEVTNGVLSVTITSILKSKKNFQIPCSQQFTNNFADYYGTSKNGFIFRDIKNYYNVLEIRFNTRKNFKPSVHFHQEPNSCLKIYNDCWINFKNLNFLQNNDDTKTLHLSRKTQTLCLDKKIEQIYPTLVTFYEIKSNESALLLNQDNGTYLLYIVYGGSVYYDNYLVLVDLNTKQHFICRDSYWVNKFDRRDKIYCVAQTNHPDVYVYIEDRHYISKVLLSNNKVLDFQHWTSFSMCMPLLCPTDGLIMNFAKILTGYLTYPQQWCVIANNKDLFYN